MGIEYSGDDVRGARQMARWDRPLAKGTYEGEIVDAVEHEGPKGPCGKFTFEMISATAEQAPEGPVKLDHFVATLGGVREFFEALDPAELRKARPVLEPEIYKGAFCRVVVGDEEYNGSRRPKIVRLLPLEVKKGATTTSATTNGAKTTKPATQKPTPAPKADPSFPFAGGEASGDEDIPF